MSAVLCTVLLLVAVVAGCSSQPAPSGQTVQPPPASSAPAAASPAAPPVAPSTAPPLNSATASAAAAATPAKTFNFKYSFHEPGDSWASTHALLPWARNIESATNGRIKIQAYPAQTLAKGTDQWQAVKNGVADIGWCFLGYWPGQTPLSDVVSLPFMQFKNAEQASTVLWQLYQKYPQIQNEYKDCKVLTLFTSDPYFLINSKRQIKSKEDLAGLKLRITGGPPTDAMKALGASPMLVSMNDMYMNLQKGVMDGAAINWMSIDAMRFYEVTKYYTYAPLYVVYFAMVMNWDAWNSLPADVQKQVEASGGGLESAKFMGKNFFDSATLAIPEKVRKAGYDVNEYTLPAAEINRWVEASSASYNSWSDKLKGGTVDPAALIKDAQSLIQSAK
jgi:TRAP-type transport system periplasmic protein